MLKLFECRAGETDWVAARDEQHARQVLMAEYEINGADLEDTEIAEVDPNAVTVNLDEVGVETEEQASKTAAEVMEEIGRPGIVCSTAW